MSLCLFKRLYFILLIIILSLFITWIILYNLKNKINFIFSKINYIEEYIDNFECQNNYSVLVDNDVEYVDDNHIQPLHFNPPKKINPYNKHYYK